MIIINIVLQITVKSIHYYDCHPSHTYTFPCFTIGRLLNSQMPTLQGEKKNHIFGSNIKTKYIRSGLLSFIVL